MNDFLQLFPGSVGHVPWTSCCCCGFVGCGGQQVVRFVAAGLLEAGMWDNCDKRFAAVGLIRCGAFARCICCLWFSGIGEVTGGIGNCSCTNRAGTRMNPSHA